MLLLETRQPGKVPIEVIGTSPRELAPLSLESVRQRKVYAGNRQVRLDSLFEITGSAGDGQQHWTGALENISGIGYRMTEGQIRISGNAGPCAGARMSGGTLRIQGNAGSWLGCEMTGGLIHVAGNVGNGCGAAWPGSPSGQNGGTILIEGNAGDGLGHLMRRGIVAVRGDVGNCCGWLMRAGSILVGGRTGKNLAAEMQRGTVILRRQPRSPLPGFDSAGIHCMPVARLLNRYVRDIGLPMPLDDSRFHLYHGDRLHGARGELLVAVDGCV